MGFLEIYLVISLLMSAACTFVAVKKGALDRCQLVPEAVAVFLVLIPAWPLVAPGCLIAWRSSDS